MQQVEALLSETIESVGNAIKGRARSSSNPDQAKQLAEEVTSRARAESFDSAVTSNASTPTSSPLSSRSSSSQDLVANTSKRKLDFGPSSLQAEETMYDHVLNPVQQSPSLGHQMNGNLVRQARGMSTMAAVQDPVSQATTEAATSFFAKVGAVFTGGVLLASNDTDSTGTSVLSTVKATMPPSPDSDHTRFLTAEDQREDRQGNPSFVQKGISVVDQFLLPSEVNAAMHVLGDSSHGTADEGFEC